MSNHPRPGGGEPNDPKWERWAGFSVGEGKSEPGGVPTLGLGAYRCNCCQEVNFAIAIVHPDGREFSITIPDDVMNAFLLDAETRLRSFGFGHLSNQALSALTMVAELARMTDTDADFLDGSGLREACRLILKGGEAQFTAFPHLYTTEDAQRAAAELERQAGGLSAAQTVAIVAESLGLQPAVSVQGIREWAEERRTLPGNGGDRG